MLMLAAGADGIDDPLGGLALEYWTLIFAAVAAGAGVIAVYYAWRQDQLRTDLEVVEVQLLSPEESAYTRDLIATGIRPHPDKVVRVVLRNRGKVTAFQTTGDITFDPPAVQSRLDFLPAGSTIYYGEDGQPNGVGFGVEAGFRVRPGQRNVDIPVLVTSSGTTMQVECWFSTPTGTPAESMRSLEIPRRS